MKHTNKKKIAIRTNLSAYNTPATVPRTRQYNNKFRIIISCDRPSNYHGLSAHNILATHRALFSINHIISCMLLPAICRTGNLTPIKLVAPTIALQAPLLTRVYRWGASRQAAGRVARASAARPLWTGPALWWLAASGPSRGRRCSRRGRRTPALYRPRQDAAKKRGTLGCGLVLLGA